MEDPCWDCIMLRKLGIETAACEGGKCRTLEDAVLTEEQLARLQQLSDEAISEERHRHDIVHQFGHRRLSKIVLRKRKELAVPAVSE